MSNHTRGPWMLKHVDGSNFAVQRFEIRGMFGNKPGVAPIFNKDTTAIDGATICCSPQDARLIAAAPELLDALVNLVRANAIAVDGSMARRVAMQLAEEAIAEAKGEQT